MSEINCNDLMDLSGLNAAIILAIQAGDQDGQSHAYANVNVALRARQDSPNLVDGFWAFYPVDDRSAIYDAYRAAYRRAS